MGGGIACAGTTHLVERTVICIAHSTAPFAGPVSAVLAAETIFVGIATRVPNAYPTLSLANLSSPTITFATPESTHALVSVFANSAIFVLRTHFVIDATHNQCARIGTFTAIGGRA